MLRIGRSCCVQSVILSDGAEGAAGEALACDRVLPWLTHKPFGRRPTILMIRVRRYQCCECAHMWRQDANETAVAMCATIFRSCPGRGYVEQCQGDIFPSITLIVTTTYQEDE